MTVKLVFMQINTWSLEIQNNITLSRLRLTGQSNTTMFFIKTLHVSAGWSAIIRLKYIDVKKQVQMQYKYIISNDFAIIFTLK